MGRRSWQVTVLSLILVPAFRLPARFFGSKLAEITRESYNLDAKMSAEAFAAQTIRHHRPDPPALGNLPDPPNRLLDGGRPAPALAA
jgi:hypothetical protein